MTYLALTPDRWLTPAEIVRDAPSDLLSTTNGADYIVISHPEFLPAAQTLATYRAGHLPRTKVVDVVDVYDEFGYGLSVPEAIRAFLRHAYDNWEPPAPTYAVFMGDGTYDPKEYLGKGERELSLSLVGKRRHLVKRDCR